MTTPEPAAAGAPLGRFFDSLTRSRRELRPGAPGRVTIYACGPTVYDVPHIGNYRTFVWVDVLHRYLRWRGLDVNLVMNITDVDDRIILGARDAGVEIDEFTEPYIERFFEGLDRLGVLRATSYPRATRYVESMIALIERLLDAGHAYELSGDVFFRVESFPDYGKLSRRDPSEMRSTERVADDEFAKEDARDFALWKATDADEPGWDAPFGRGRPGWHLECSAMSMELLGETIDVHCGGIDLAFPHHENEIAQSEASTGRPFARFWMHCHHLVVDGTKMSKSLGNFYTLEDLIERGRDGDSIRYLLVSAHHRSQLNFTQAGLDQAEASLARLRALKRRLDEAAEADTAETEPEPLLAGHLDEARRRFAEALADDLNTPAALGHVFSFAREAHTLLDARPQPPETARAAAGWLDDVGEVLGLRFAERRVELRIEHASGELLASGPPLDDSALELIERRTRARFDRDFARADELRDRLAAMGIELEDVPDGLRWKTR